MSTFKAGELVRISSAFTNDAGAAANPTGVRFKHKNPEGTVTSLVYGTDAALVRDSTGNYHVDIDTTDQPGTWYWRSWATGTGQTADEGTFEVETSF